jgi:hypothetical protein
MRERPDNDEELLQRALDGALGAADAAQLRERLARDESVRARAEQLRRLADLMEGQEAVEPPPTFADHVMEAVVAGAAERSTWFRRCAARAAAVGRQLLGLFPHHSGQSESGSESPWMTGTAGGGAIVAKKALWAVAGLALIVIVGVGYYYGTRSVNGGAEGTIGAADRYRGAQPTATDVKAQQAAAQKFLQTDTFDRLIKDKNVRSLLADHEFCNLLAEAGPMEALQDAEMVADLRKGGRALADNQEMYEALRSGKARAALAEVENLEALKHKGTRAALSDVECLEALKKAHTALANVDESQFFEALRSKQRALKLASSEQDALENLRKNKQFAMAMQEEPFMNLMKSRAFLQALDDVSFMDLMKSRASLAMLDDANFEALMKARNGRFLQSFDNAEFANLMHNSKFLVALADNDAVMEALRNPGFKASLQQFEALQVALKEHPQQ